MSKKEKNKLSGFDVVKTIGYILVIVLVFSPLTFLVSNTITGTIDNNCYSRQPVKIADGEEYDYAAERACEEAYDQAREDIEQQQFLIVSIISIVTILLLLFFGTSIDAIISYSLFFASSLNTIIIVIKNSSSSILAAGLGVVLFILVLLFINKNLKKS